jgi:hypothetical protein
MSLKPGDILKAKDKPTLRVVGRSPNGKRWLAERVDEFGPPFPVEFVSLTTDYGVTDPALPPDEATVLRQRDQEATDAANRAYGRGHRETRRNRLPGAGEFVPPPGSPEAIFAAAAADAHED